MQATPIAGTFFAGRVYGLLAETYSGTKVRSNLYYRQGNGITLGFRVRLLTMNQCDTINIIEGPGLSLLTFPDGSAFPKVQHKDATKFESLDDKSLALAFKAGNLSAFDEIVRRYQGRVYAAAYRVTGNREDALDVAQEALVKAYRKIDAWQPTGGFLSWLLRLTTNQAIDHIRRRKRRHQERLDDAFRNESEGAAVEPTVIDTEDAVRANEIDARIRASLVVLSPRQRDVFVLRHFEGFSLAEIAEEQKCTVGSVKVHLFRAMKKLREELNDFAPYV